MCDLNLFDLLDDDVQLQKGLWSLSFFYIKGCIFISHSLGLISRSLPEDRK